MTTAQTLNEKWLAFKWLEKILRSVALFMAKTFYGVALFSETARIHSCTRFRYSKCHGILPWYFPSPFQIFQLSNLSKMTLCFPYTLQEAIIHISKTYLFHYCRPGITSELHSFHRTSSFIPGRFVIAVPRVKLSNWVCADSCITRNIAHWKRYYLKHTKWKVKASYWVFICRMWQRHVQPSQPKTAVRGRQQLCRLAARTRVQS